MAEKHECSLVKVGTSTLVMVVDPSGMRHPIRGRSCDEVISKLEQLTSKRVKQLVVYVTPDVGGYCAAVSVRGDGWALVPPKTELAVQWDEPRADNAQPQR